MATLYPHYHIEGNIDFETNGFPDQILSSAVLLTMCIGFLHSPVGEESKRDHKHTTLKADKQQLFSSREIFRNYLQLNGIFFLQSLDFFGIVVWFQENNSLGKRFNYF